MQAQGARRPLFSAIARGADLWGGVQDRVTVFLDSPFYVIRDSKVSKYKSRRGSELKVRSGAIQHPGARLIPVFSRAIS